MGITGLAILVYALSNPEKKSKKIKSKNPAESIKNLENQPIPEQLKTITTSVKNYVKKQFNISNKLSLNEISQHLGLIEQPKLQEICEDLKKFHYTEKQPTKKDLQQLTDKLNKTIDEIQQENEKQLLAKQKNQTIIDKLKDREQNLKQNIRVQRIIHSKIKNKSKNEKNISRGRSDNLSK